MTTQAPDIFGRDIRCDPITEDADAFMSEVTGVDLVKQDLRHRLMVDSVLGPDGDSDGFFDIRKLVGATAGTAATYQARIKRVVVHDQRIQSASVVITEEQVNGLVVTDIVIVAQTALGPFRLAFRLDPSQPLASQVAIIEAQ